uniref:G-protein coupled receptors family 1 profile domain-containing protein n=1 Tax=Plectus sambesii TaxID=2011161 RepID=A0A914UI96_9BILA
MEHAEEHKTDAPLDVAKYYYIAVIYACLGVVLTVVNGTLLVALLRHRVLRIKKEYTLLAGLVFSDLLLGLSTGSGGIYELALINRHEENVQVHRTACLWTPFFLIKTFTCPAEACMLLIISVDRLIAVLKPLKYATFTRIYAILLVGISLCVGVIITLFLTLNLELQKSDDTINAVCLLSKMGKIYMATNCYVRFVLATLSVIVYIFVGIAYRRYQMNMCKAFPTSQDRLRKVQRRLTTTVGMCALLTFLLYLLPTTIAILHLESDTTVWVSVCWVLINVNAVANVFVYSLRHEDIRQGIKLLILCRKMPTVAQERLRLESITSSSSSVASRAALLTMRTAGSTLLPRVIPAKLYRNIIMQQVT